MLAARDRLAVNDTGRATQRGDHLDGLAEKLSVSSSLVNSKGAPAYRSFLAIPSCANQARQLLPVETTP
jgi:hypothetical protein